MLNIIVKGDFNVIKHTACNKPICNFHINKAIYYTYQNYTEPLNIEKMAKYLEINKCYFCQLFKKETGKTYSQFLNEIRIEKSKELLKNTDMSILDIALSVGYNNQNYYTMAFKKITGVTPLKYRNLRLAQ